MKTRREYIKAISKREIKTGRGWVTFSEASLQRKTLPVLKELYKVSRAKN